MQQIGQILKLGLFCAGKSFGPDRPLVDLALDGPRAGSVITERSRSWVEVRGAKFVPGALRRPAVVDRARQARPERLRREVQRPATGRVLQPAPVALRHVREEIAAWRHHDNGRRRHPGRGYRSPMEYVTTAPPREPREGSCTASTSVAAVLPHWEMLLNRLDGGDVAHLQPENSSSLRP